MSEMSVNTQLRGATAFSTFIADHTEVAAETQQTPEELAEIAKGGGEGAVDATVTLILQAESHACLLGDIPEEILEEAIKRLNERNHASGKTDAPIYQLINRGDQRVLVVKKGTDREEIPITPPSYPPPTPATFSFKSGQREDQAAAPPPAGVR